MKKILNVLMMTLAINFLLVAGFVAWLSHDGRLDRARITAIKDILFPPPPVEAPATQPVTDQLAEPTMKLEELLAKTAGRPAAMTRRKNWPSASSRRSAWRAIRGFRTVYLCMKLYPRSRLRRYSWVWRMRR